MKVHPLLIVLPLLLLVSGSGYSQGDNSLKGEKFADRLIVGGGLGLQFGDYTYVQVAPIIVYRVTERLHSGIGLNYTYYKVNDKAYGYKYETSVYGGSLWSRYFVFENLFGEVTYELLNLEVPEVIGGYFSGYKRDNVSILMVGGGYAKEIGGSSLLLFRVLWDVIEDPYSPYANPIFSIGFSVGL